MYDQLRALKEILDGLWAQKYHNRATRALCFTQAKWFPDSAIKAVARNRGVFKPGPFWRPITVDETIKEAQKVGMIEKVPRELVDKTRAVMYKRGPNFDTGWFQPTNEVEMCAPVKYLKLSEFCQILTDEQAKDEELLEDCVGLVHEIAREQCFYSIMPISDNGLFVARPPRNDVKRFQWYLMKDFYRKMETGA